MAVRQTSIRLVCMTDVMGSFQLPKWRCFQTLGLERRSFNIIKAQSRVQPLEVLSLIELDDGKIYRKALYLMVKTMVSCRFSLKSIQWESRKSDLQPDPVVELPLWWPRHATTWLCDAKKMAEWRSACCSRCHGPKTACSAESQLGAALRLFLVVQSMGLPSSKIPWKSWKWIDLGVPPWLSWLSAWWWLEHGFYKCFYIFFDIFWECHVIPTVTHNPSFFRGLGPAAQPPTSFGNRCSWCRSWRLFQSTSLHGTRLGFQKASWVCLKMSAKLPEQPNGFADHYPYEKWLAIIGNINPTFSGPNPLLAIRGFAKVSLAVTALQKSSCFRSW